MVGFESVNVSCIKNEKISYFSGIIYDFSKRCQCQWSMIELLHTSVWTMIEFLLTYGLHGFAFMHSNSEHWTNAFISGGWGKMGFCFIRHTMYCYFCTWTNHCKFKKILRYRLTAHFNLHCCFFFCLNFLDVSSEYMSKEGHCAQIWQKTTWDE